MAKKIALVAPYISTNYGTMLQAYALAHKINELGYECEYINYTPYYKLSVYERIIRKIKRLFHIEARVKKLTYEGVDDFRYIFSEQFAPLRKSCLLFSEYNIPHSEVCYTPKTIQQSTQTYNRFIVGSDQTWSIERYISMNGFYLLPFLKNNVKCYAYAPSIGTTTIAPEYTKILLRQLSKFEALSCREATNSRTLGKLMRREVFTVVDPTMLITGKEWKNIEKKVELPSKYILAYILGEKECISAYGEELGKQLELPVYYVCTRPKYIEKLYHLPIGLSPEQWLWAVDNAYCIVTDSFHGCLFSINFNRDFYVFTKREEAANDFNDNDRIMELLKTYGLEERFVHDNYEKVSFNSISYEAKQNQINRLRAESIVYLQSIIG